ncbi:hypothetical protein H6775_01465 [Candidatus Nomurabacteria bacterium]|nr:hypothetical protein [Candidatus Nomurabacteria bacterium]
MKKKQIEEFQNILKEEFNILIDKEDAEMKAYSLVDYFKLLINIEMNNKNSKQR